jgi:receptor protein-tyrosine kinase
MAQNPSHLVERVAERLRGVGGLAVPEPPPGREARAESWPEAEPRSASESGPGMRGRLHGDLARLEDEPDIPAPDAGSELEPPAGRQEPDLQMADGELRPSDPVTALAPVPRLPEPGRMPPLDVAALEKAGLVVGHKVRTRISEEFRITVGHLLRAMQSNYSPGRGSPNVIMITSARPSEGKSFSALNLAGSIAQHTQREVLLIDIDAKQRSISSQLGLMDRPGLLDLSNNPSLRIEDVIIRTSIPHLSLMPVGSGQSGGLDITQTRPVTALVERIARRFPNSVVLLDAPPCLSTSDPSTLAPFVGQIVMVVEAERTQRNEVIAALDLVKACPSVTLMLNKIQLTTSYTFGAYHYFGTYS